MQTDFIYLRYYGVILFSVILLKIFFIILNRMAKKRLVLPANFFLLTLVFSYLGLSAGFIIGETRQTSITIAVLAMLSFVCGTIAVIFNDRYNTGFNKKIASYSLVLITMAIALGSRAESFNTKKQEDIDAKNIFRHETKDEKYKAVLKKNEQAFVFYQSM